MIDYQIFISYFAKVRRGCVKNLKRDRSGVKIIFVENKKEEQIFCSSKIG